MVAGIDCSINGTGVAFSDGSFHFHTGLKRLPKRVESELVTGYTVKGFDKNGNSERYYLNARDIVEKCKSKNVKVVGIENYAYGYGHQNPGRVFDIAEYTGMVKALLVQAGAKIVTFAPSEIKKFASGKGNATKIIMVEKYFSEFPDGVLAKTIESFELDRYQSPINDMVDAHYLMKMVERDIELSEI